MLKRGKVAEAEASCRRAAELKPDYAAGQADLGRALRVAGKLDAAEASLRKALALAPNMAEAHAALSTVLLERRDAVAAEPHARRRWSSTRATSRPATTWRWPWPRRIGWPKRPKSTSGSSSTGPHTWPLTSAWAWCAATSSNSSRRPLLFAA